MTSFLSSTEPEESLTFRFTSHFCYGAQGAPLPANISYSTFNTSQLIQFDSTVEGQFIIEHSIFNGTLSFSSVSSSMISYSSILISNCTFWGTLFFEKQLVFTLGSTVRIQNCKAFNGFRISSKFINSARVIFDNIQSSNLSTTLAIFTVSEASFRNSSKLIIANSTIKTISTVVLVEETTDFADSGSSLQIENCSFESEPILTILGAVDIRGNVSKNAGITVRTSTVVCSTLYCAPVMSTASFTSGGFLAIVEGTQLHATSVSTVSILKVRNINGGSFIFDRTVTVFGPQSALDIAGSFIVNSRIELGFVTIGALSYRFSNSQEVSSNVKVIVTQDAKIIDSLVFNLWRASNNTFRFQGPEGGYVALASCQFNCRSNNCQNIRVLFVNVILNGTTPSSLSFYDRYERSSFAVLNSIFIGALIQVGQASLPSLTQNSDLSISNSFFAANKLHSAVVIEGTTSNSSIIIQNSSFIRTDSFLSQQLIALNGVMSASTLTVASCALTSYAQHLIYVGQALSSGTVHLYADNTFVQACTSFSWGTSAVYYVDPLKIGGNVTLLGNSFKSAMPNTYLIYLTNVAGAFVFAKNNTCSSTGRFEVVIGPSEGEGPANDIHIHNFSKMGDIFIAMNASSVTFGRKSSILISDTNAAALTARVGQGSFAVVRLWNVTVNTLMIEWAECYKCAIELLQVKSSSLISLFSDALLVDSTVNIFDVEANQFSLSAAADSSTITIKNFLGVSKTSVNSIPTFSISTAPSAPFFVNSTLEIENCTALAAHDDAAKISIAVERESVFRITNSLFGVNCSLSVCGPPYYRALAFEVLDSNRPYGEERKRGNLIIENNTFFVSNRTASLVEIVSNGTDVKYYSSNRIISGGGRYLVTFLRPLKGSEIHLSNAELDDLQIRFENQASCDGLVVSLSNVTIWINSTIDFGGTPSLSVSDVNFAVGNASSFIGGLAVNVAQCNRCNIQITNTSFGPTNGPHIHAIANAVSPSLEVEGSQLTHSFLLFDNITAACTFVVRFSALQTEMVLKSSNIKPVNIPFSAVALELPNCTWVHSSILVQGTTIATESSMAVGIFASMRQASTLIFRNNTVIAADLKGGQTANGVGGALRVFDVSDQSMLIVDENLLVVETTSFYVFSALLSKGAGIIYGGNNTCNGGGRWEISIEDSTIAGDTLYTLHLRQHSLSSLKIGAGFGTKVSKGCVLIEDTTVVDHTSIDLAPTAADSTVSLVRSIFQGSFMFMHGTACKKCNIVLANNRINAFARIMSGPQNILTSTVAVIANNTFTAAVELLLYAEAGTLFSFGPNNAAKIRVTISVELNSSAMYFIGNHVGGSGNYETLGFDSTSGSHGYLVITDNVVETLGDQAVRLVLQMISATVLLKNNIFSSASTTTSPVMGIKSDFMSVYCATLFISNNTVVSRGDNQSLNTNIELQGGRIVQDSTNTYQNGKLAIALSRSVGEGSYFALSCSGNRSFITAFSLSQQSIAPATNSYVSIDNCAVEGDVSISFRATVGGFESYSTVSVRAVSARTINVSFANVSDSRAQIIDTNSRAMYLFDGTNATANVSLLVLNCFSAHLNFSPLMMSCPHMLPCFVMFFDNSLYPIDSGSGKASPGLLLVGGKVGDSSHILVVNNTFVPAASSLGGTIFFESSALFGSVNLTIANNTVGSSSTVYGLAFGSPLLPISGSVEIWSNTMNSPMLISAGPRLVHMNVINNYAEHYESAAVSNLSNDLAYHSMRSIACNRQRTHHNSQFPPDFNRYDCAPAQKVLRCPNPQNLIYGPLQTSDFLEQKAVTEPFTMCEHLVVDVPSFVLDASRAAQTILIESILSSNIGFSEFGLNSFQGQTDHREIVGLLFTLDPSQLAADHIALLNRALVVLLGSRKFKTLMEIATFGSRNEVEFCSTWEDHYTETATATRRSLSISHEQNLSRTVSIFSSRASPTLTPLSGNTSATRRNDESSITSEQSHLTHQRSRSVNATSQSRTIHETHSKTKKPTQTRNLEQSRTLSSTFEAPRTQTIRHLPPIPVSVIKDALVATSQVAGIVTSISSLGSVSGGQLGVANAVLRLASCSDEDDKVEDVPALVHPLRFAIGKGEVGAYTAASIGNTIIIPAIVAVLTYYPVRLFLVRIRGVSGERALVTLGWPAVVMMPFVTLAEGIGVSVVRAIRSGTNHGVTFGLLGASSTLCFLAMWLRVLAVVIPRRAVALRVNEESTGGCVTLFVRLVVPTQLWEPLTQVKEKDEFPVDDSRLAESFLLESDNTHLEEVDGLANNRVAESQAYDANNRPRSRDAHSSSWQRLDDNLERYANALGDKRLFYAEIVSFSLSLVVGVCEAAPPSFCVGRAFIAVIATIAQCVMSCMTLVPLELALQILMSLFVVPMSLAVLVSAWYGDEAPATATDAAALLSVLANVVGMVLLVLGLGIGAMELLTERGAVAGIKQQPLLCQRLPPAVTLSELSIESNRGILPTISFPPSPATDTPTDRGNANDVPSSLSRRAHADFSVSEDLEDDIIIVPRPSHENEEGEDEDEIELNTFFGNSNRNNNVARQKNTKNAVGGTERANNNNYQCENVNYKDEGLNLRAHFTSAQSISKGRVESVKEKEPTASAVASHFRRHGLNNNNNNGTTERLLSSKGALTSHFQIGQRGSARGEVSSWGTLIARQSAKQPLSGELLEDEEHAADRVEENIRDLVRASFPGPHK